MDEVKTPSREAGYSISTIVVAFALTFEVFLRVLYRWHDFGILTRFDVVVLLMSLWAVPVASIRARRRETPLWRDYLVILAYSSLFLATALFPWRS
jgi:hypothetical protein